MGWGTVETAELSRREEPVLSLSREAVRDLEKKKMAYDKDVAAAGKAAKTGKRKFAEEEEMEEPAYRAKAWSNRARGGAGGGAGGDRKMACYRCGGPHPVNRCNKPAPVAPAGSGSASASGGN